MTLIAFVLVALTPEPGSAQECFLLQKIGDSNIHTVGGDECAVRSAPASTFKVPHALIALETKVITAAEVVKWDGKEQSFDSWERDHTLDSAMKSSVYPFFIRTASLIGRERMREWLTRLRYGTDSFDGELTSFWTNGDFEISPREQLDFLARMFAGELAASLGNVEIVKNSFRMPPAKISNAAGIHDFALRWQPGTVVYAKTGNTRVEGTRISWLVGAIESRGETWVFAARKRAKTPLTTTAGADVALRELNAILVLHNATVIDGTGAAPRTGVDVLVRGERIEAITTTCAHRGQVFDVDGKIVVPGFIDMHAHLQERVRDAKGELTPRVDWALTRDMLKLYLQHGITTVRDPGAPTEAAVTLRRMVAEGEVPGPRIFTAGRILTASSFNEEPFQPVRTAAAIEEEIRWQAAAGVDFIKIYSSMTPDLAKVAIDAGHSHGLPVIGHLQRTTWTDAARLGIDAIAHGAPWSPEYLAESDRSAYPQTMFGRVYWLEHLDVDGGPVREMISELAKRRVAVDPTLIAYHTKFFGDQPRWRENKDNRLMREDVVAGWRAGNFTRDWTPEQYTAARTAWPKQLALTKAMFDGGVLMTVGTDAPTAWIVPGASFHDEMALLRDAGIPPLDVIRMATHNAAVALRRENEIGAVKAGFIADLVVLDSIENTRSIAMVIQRGRIVR